MKELTKAQERALECFATACDRAWGIPPTVRELTALLGATSTNGTAGTLRLLVRKGYLEHHPRKSRAFRLSGKGID